MSQYRPPRWIGYLAAGLILAHAALSAYWAAGGTAGLNLLSEGIQEEAEARRTWFAAMVWGVAILKLAVGLVALGMVREWRLPVPRWMLLLVVWGTGVVLTAYGLIQLLGGVSVVLGIVDGPDDRSTAFWAYLLLWAPLWTAIGALYLLTGWWATADPEQRQLGNSAQRSRA